MPASTVPPSPRGRGLTRGSVKGSVLQSRLQYVKSTRGDACLGRVLSRLSDHDRQILGGMLMPFAWYPFDTNDNLDRAIAEELGLGDQTFILLGEASAKDNLTTASQQTYMREKNPHGLLKHTSAIYKVYYDTGYRTYEKLDEGHAVLRTFESASFSRSDCLTVVGWHRKAIEMCGGRSASVREPKCRARGGEFCEYVCEWEIG